MEIVAIHFICPRCHAVGGNPCQTSSGATRPPHWQRLLLDRAQKLVALACGEDRATVGAVSSAVDLAQAATARPGRSASPSTDDTASGSVSSKTADHLELAVLTRSVEILSLVAAGLEHHSGRSLDLSELTVQARGFGQDLEHAHTMAQLRHRGLARPEDVDPRQPEPPTPEQAQVWKELHDNQVLRERTARRDHIAAERAQALPLSSRRWPNVHPVHWRVSAYLPSGHYLAERQTADARPQGEGAQPDLYCWAAVPEAVPDMLRQWSIPPDRAVRVDWAVEPPRPPRRLPERGHRPDARSYHRLAAENGESDPRAAMHDQPAEELAAFADAVTALRERLPAIDIEELLEQAADRLHMEEEPAADLKRLAHGGADTRHPTLYLGTSVTTGWIDPAKAVLVDAWRSNSTSRLLTYSTRERDEVVGLARALLANDPSTAFQSWKSGPGRCSVIRVPGPAGPLYQYGYGGSGIHVARMLGFPLVWAEIRQYTPPMRISLEDLASDMYCRLIPNQVRQIIDCWRGLLDRGLIIGDLDEDAQHPTQTALHLDWAAAPWLPAEPARAIGWAAHYQRAYPGALAKLGVPDRAWSTGTTWHSWLTSA
ncbi:hypothetical protein ACIBF1_30055 [Spirillospora sp. NPDC050679]